MDRSNPVENREKSIGLSVFLSSAIVFCCVINWLSWRKWGHQGQKSIIVNLVFGTLLTDSLALLVPTPILISSTAHPSTLRDNRALCQAQAIMWNSLTFTSTVLVTVLVYERFVRTVYPTKTAVLFSVGKSSLIILLSATISGIGAFSPNFLDRGYHWHSSLYHCHATWRPLSWIPLAHCLFLFLEITTIPLSVYLQVYGKYYAPPWTDGFTNIRDEISWLNVIFLTTYLSVPFDATCLVITILDGVENNSHTAFVLMFRTALMYIPLVMRSLVMYYFSSYYSKHCEIQETGQISVHGSRVIQNGTPVAGASSQEIVIMDDNGIARRMTDNILHFGHINWTTQKRMKQQSSNSSNSAVADPIHTKNSESSNISTIANGPQASHPVDVCNSVSPGVNKVEFAPKTSALRRGKTDFMFKLWGRFSDSAAVRPQFSDNSTPVKNDSNSQKKLQLDLSPGSNAQNRRTKSDDNQTQSKSFSQEGITLKSSPPQGNKKSVITIISIDTGHSQCSSQFSSCHQSLNQPTVVEVMTKEIPESGLGNLGAKARPEHLHTIGETVQYNCHHSIPGCVINNFM